MSNLAVFDFWHFAGRWHRTIRIRIRTAADNATKHAESLSLRERKISPKFFRLTFFHGNPRGMSVPTCLFFQDLEALTEVFGRMSAGISAPKLPLWAEFLFLISLSLFLLENLYQNTVFQRSLKDPVLLFLGSSRTNQGKNIKYKNLWKRRGSPAKKRKFLARPLCRNASRIFVVKILEDFAGDFPGG